MNNSNVKNRESSKDALKTIYYVIIGLAIAEALNRTFINGFHFERFILLLALMPTICRFVHGASIHLDTTPQGKPKKLLYDFIVFFLQASFFYVMAITLDKPFVFLTVFIVMLLVDMIWLIILKKISYISFGPTERQWLWSDSLIIGVFLIFCLIHTYLYSFNSLAVVIFIFAIGAIATYFDYSMNEEYYFPKEFTVNNPCKIYIAGPYTSNTPAGLSSNVKIAINAAIEIFRKGHFPYVPHLTHFVDEQARENEVNLEWGDYMKWHDPWLNICDALLYMVSSKGADLELKEAKKLGKKIFYSIEEIPTLK